MEQVYLLDDRENDHQNSVLLVHMNASPSMANKRHDKSQGSNATRNDVWTPQW